MYECHDEFFEGFLDGGEEEGGEGFGGEHFGRRDGGSSMGIGGGLKGDEWCGL